MVKADVKGLDEVAKVLKQFPIKLRTNALRGAVRAGAKVLLEEAKQKVPVRSGNLRDSLSIVKLKSKDKKWMTYAVTPRRITKKKNGVKGIVADGYYGHIVEYGNSKMKAQPYLRPALLKEKEALDATRRYLSKKVDKLVRQSK